MSQIVAELVPEYLAARRAELPRMLELLAASDFERLKILGHSLKGSGGSFGFPELSSFGGALERHALEADSVSCGRELDRVQEFLERLDNAAAGSPPR